MIKLRALAIAGFVFILAACNHSNKNTPENNSAAKTLNTDSAGQNSAQSHSKLVKALVKDTVNRLNYIDSDGKRQGHWIITDKMRHLPGYDSNAKVEEGYYRDNMKEGQWIEYNADGSVKSTINYKDNKPL